MCITPIPACDITDIGVVHDVSSFEQYFAPTRWLYEKSSKLVHDRCIAKRGNGEDDPTTEGNPTGILQCHLYDVPFRPIGNLRPRRCAERGEHTQALKNMW